jgi:hypothetical protein
MKRRAAAWAKGGLLSCQAGFYSPAAQRKRSAQRRESGACQERPPINIKYIAAALSRR